MKSVLVSFLMFAIIITAIYFGVFDVLASPYMLLFATAFVVIVLIFAVRILGNPLANKDLKNGDRNKK